MAWGDGVSGIMLVSRKPESSSCFLLLTGDGVLGIIRLVSCSSSTDFDFLFFIRDFICSDVAVNSMDHGLKRVSASLGVRRFFCHFCVFFFLGDIAGEVRSII